MAQLRPKTDEIRGLGAELVLVGNGSVEQLRWFIEDQAPGVPVYTDPSRVVYRAVGLRRDAKAILNVKTAAALVRARRAGFNQPGVKGDPWQQGGALVILPGGFVAYRHGSEYLGDQPAPDTMVAALREAVAGAGAGANA